MYSQIKLAKELWESMEKYKTGDVGSNKFVIRKILDYKMVESKPAISYVKELQVLVHNIHEDNMVLCKPFQVDVIIGNSYLDGRFQGLSKT